MFFVVSWIVGQMAEGVINLLTELLRELLSGSSPFGGRSFPFGGMDFPWY
jgi:hypothetical protein